MIDKPIFAAGMGVLCGTFGRTLDEPTSRAFFQVLNPRLNNEQFQKAVDTALANETIWASPAKLLQYAGVTDESIALCALETVTAAINAAGGHRFMTFAQYDAFDDATKRAIMACGGLPKLATCSEEKWPAMQRKFAAAYNGVPQLAATGTDDTDGRVKGLASHTARVLTLSGKDRTARNDA